MADGCVGAASFVDHGLDDVKIATVTERVCSTAFAGGPPVTEVVITGHIARRQRFVFDDRIEDVHLVGGDVEAGTGNGLYLDQSRLGEQQFLAAVACGIHGQRNAVRPWIFIDMNRIR